MAVFDGKVALLTGAASGIGRAVAQRLASGGAKVFGVDVNPDGLAETARLVADAGGVMESGCFDLRRREQCCAAVERAVQSCGRLDVVGNIAGVNVFHHFTDMREEEWNLILAVNLSATAFVCQAAIPHLLETKGNIVNVASVAAFKGQAYTAAYCASKGGVVQLTKALAMEYVDRGIRVNALAPGGVNTPLTSQIDFPEGIDWKLMQPYIARRGMAEADDIASAFAYLASDEARIVHGAVWAVDHGITAG
jgi:NAD(P)-dependent dehydrogenase (short-subunit alcohol dehydrogenase family)